MPKSKGNTVRRGVRPRANGLAGVHISEASGIRSLYLDSDTVQSSMSLDDPTELVLSYSRAMMAFLLFYPEPTHILQIGLGGGSLARFIDCYLPAARNVVVEINPQVVAAARAFFELPPEGLRFEIIEADGADYVQNLDRVTDAILVDGFDGFQIAEALTTEYFMKFCYRALSLHGIFVANWWSKDRCYPELVERLLGIFEGRVLELPAASHGNIVVMAFRQTPSVLALDALQCRAMELKALFRLEFDEFVERLALTNQLYNRQLIL